jgi:FAD dependent oxidoreductase TIGR03364
MRSLVVGAGILGTWIATRLLEQGHEVIHVEQDASPRGASIQNLGLIWISGRAPGRELALARGARERWVRQHDLWPELPFRPAGSLTLPAGRLEAEALEAAAALPDAEERGLGLLGAGTIATRFGYAARGAGLLGAYDAVTEPREVLGVMRRYLARDPLYRFQPSMGVIACDEREAVLADRARVPFDTAFFATGTAELASLGFDDGNRLVRTQLQMLETEVATDRLEPAVADADSLRYYPAYASIRALLPPQDPLAKEHAAQLLMVRRTSGALTIGDTHEPAGAPFLRADIEDYLRGRAEAVLGLALPPTATRWLGCYAQLAPADPEVYFVTHPHPNVTWVTGLAGRGMTIAPEVAHEVVTEVCT